MSSVCPACGVAVVPGYVRCPKCHAGLSLGPGMRRAKVDPGGTTLARKGSPVLAVIAALGVAATLILVFGLRPGSQATEASLPPLLPTTAATLPDPPRTRELAAAPAPVPPPEASPPDLAAASADLEDTLRRQRLWGRVVITGQRIDLRSGSCADPAMRPLIDGKKPLLHNAGLTKLRCLEQSGAVVFER